MLGSIEQTVRSGLQTIFDQFGWLGVVGLMVFENATGITPSEIVLALAGWRLIESQGIAPYFISLAGLYAGLGSATGASITYRVARKGRHPLVDKFAKIFHIDLKHIERIEYQCNKWGTGIGQIGHLIPGVRTLVSIPAGLARIPFPKFFLATFAGAYVWCRILIGAGYLLGHEWHLFGDYIKTRPPLVLLPGCLVVAGYLVYHYRASLPFPRRMCQNREELE